MVNIALIVCLSAACNSLFDNLQTLVEDRAKYPPSMATKLKFSEAMQLIRSSTMYGEVGLRKCTRLVTDSDSEPPNCKTVPASHILVQATSFIKRPLLTAPAAAVDMQGLYQKLKISLFPHIFIYRAVSITVCYSPYLL